MKAIFSKLALEYNRNHEEKQSQIRGLMVYLRDEIQSGERAEVLTKRNRDDSQIKDQYSEIYYKEQIQHTRKHHSRFPPSNNNMLAGRASANELLTVAY
ncbi:DUF1758 domain-containing protein [Nephila pilipes]|uniref:DUF1758 domain-containing protein n=1 Tax=Nephila pilipes TaxID=299642 RepID=A0A8X6NFY3_NEPPI|nr:DUF1758 domain-containing protein [Nephila pilipes]